MLRYKEGLRIEQKLLRFSGLLKTTKSESQLFADYHRRYRYIGHYSAYLMG